MRRLVNYMSALLRWTYPLSSYAHRQHASPFRRMIHAPKEIAAEIIRFQRQDVCQEDLACDHHDYGKDGELAMALRTFLAAAQTTQSPATKALYTRFSVLPKLVAPTGDSHEGPPCEPPRNTGTELQRCCKKPLLLIQRPARRRSTDVITSDLESSYRFS